MAKAVGKLTGKPGRPPRPGPRQEIRFRLFGRELERAEEKARAAGLASVTEWCRKVVEEAAQAE